MEKRTSFRRLLRHTFRLPVGLVLRMMPLMGQVNFSYTGQLAAAAGVAEVVLDFSDDAVPLRRVLDELASRHGSKWGELIFDDAGQVRSTLLVIFDGAQVSGDKEDLTLDGVKSVMLMTPIAGG